MLPTINDIAREAGVSHGTVSNVINGRGNVSTEKIRLVWQAAKKLGYKPNRKAQSLRQGKDRTIAIILPSIEIPAFAAMYEVFQSEFQFKGYAVRLYSTRSLATFEKDMLEDAVAARVSAVITSSCLPNAVSAYLTETSDIPVVFLRRNGERNDRIMYAGFDPQTAGKDIALYLHTQKAKRVGVFSAPTSDHDCALFLQGFQAESRQADVSVIYINCPLYQIELRSFEFFQQDDPYDFIVCTDKKRETAVKAAWAYGSKAQKPRFITISNRTALVETDSLIYEIDTKCLAHKIVKALLNHLENHKSLPANLYLSNNGFRAELPLVHLVEQCLRMLTMASPSATALSALLPHLEKTTGVHLELTVLPSLRNVYDLIQTPAKSQYDLIRMDVAWMDELSERLFRPLEQIPFEWDHLLSQTLPELGDRYTTSRGTRFCVPNDPSTQLLFYRRDLFKDPTCKRMYYEAFKQELDVPKNFEEYNQIAKFFTRSEFPESPVQFGTTVAIGNVAVSPSEFMPRLFEAGGHLMDSDGKITLDTPEALNALLNYQEAYVYSDRTVYDFWGNVLKGFGDGSAAMTIVFINYASHILNSKMSSIAGKLGFAPVPGRMPLLGGGVLGITKDCAHPETACTFLSWLYSDFVAPVFTLLGGLSPCKSAYSNRDINEKYPWLSTARRSFSLAQRRTASTYYQNFSELQLEDILASKIKKAVLGILTPKEALQQAQSECNRFFTLRKF